MVFPANGYRASQRVWSDKIIHSRFIVSCKLALNGARRGSLVSVALCLEATERMTNRLRRTGARFVSYRNTSNFPFIARLVTQSPTRSPSGRRRHEVAQHDGVQAGRYRVPVSTTDGDRPPAGRL